MADEHTVFRAPDNRDLPLWRYMDFTKYIAMLEARALYFARADQFDDRFEGASTKANLDARPEWYGREEWKGSGTKLREMLPHVHEGSKKWTYINCWHANEVESAAMWRLYARSNEAIAVRSTFARLSAQMPEDIEVGLVEYIDYSKDFIPESNLMYRFMRKRQAFSHEQEVRAVGLYPIIERGQLLHGKENPELGKLVPVDLVKLIEQVYVAPTAPEWFLVLVADVTRRFGFPFSVSRSSLDDDPVY